MAPVKSINLHALFYGLAVFGGGFQFFLFRCNTVMYMQVSACFTESWSKSVNHHDPPISVVHVVQGLIIVNLSWKAMYT